MNHFFVHVEFTTLASNKGCMKYVVCAENDFCLNGWEYFGVSKCGKNVVGYHDPNLADTFKTKKEAKEFASRFEYDTKVEKVDKHIDLFKECKYVYRQFPMIDNTTSIKYDPAKHTKFDVLNFRINHRTKPERSIRYEDYRTWPELWQLFEHIWSIVGYTKSGTGLTMNTAQICVKKGSSYDKFKEELDLVIPHCTYISDDGYMVFPIFDKDLSEYGTRYLHYKSEDDCMIAESYWSEHPGTLKECFELMLKRFYYE